MKTLNYLIILAVLTTFTIPAHSEDKATLSDVTTRYEREIFENVQKSDFRKSIVAAAEYEQELISRYPPASFRANLFQSEAEHISLQSSFVGWKRIGLKELEIPEWLPMMGFNILLGLEGKVEDDRFISLSMNMGQIEQRMGLAEPGKAEMSDQELLLGATLMANQFGVVQNQEFKTIGSHHILVLDIGTPMGGPPITMVNLAHGRRFYSFVLISSLRNQQDNEEKLIKLVETVDFNYKPAKTDKIETIRGKIDKEEPQSILRCVKELAAVGEYNAAAEELAKLRILLSQRMQKPLVKDNVAYHPSYGLSLTNPDNKKWKLSIEDTGAMKMLLLEDRWSVKQEGLGLIILDLVLSFGPQAAKELEDEEEMKQVLINAGRGSALSIGSTIESERFTTVKGNFAYEATVTTNIPGGIKAKCIWMMRPGYMLGILMMVDTNTFQEKTQEYEKIIQGDFLKIGD